MQAIVTYMPVIDPDTGADHTKVTCMNKITGKLTEIILKLSFQELYVAKAKYDQGAMIQDVLPELTPDERELLLTGITPEEWEELFGKEE